MALSDTCSDTLHELGKELVWYSDWGYKPEQLIPVIDALYNLATALCSFTCNFNFAALKNQQLSDFVKLLCKLKTYINQQIT